LTHDSSQKGLPAEKSGIVCNATPAKTVSLQEGGKKRVKVAFVIATHQHFKGNKTVVKWVVGDGLGKISWPGKGNTKKNDA